MNYLFETIPENHENCFYTHLHNLTCLKVEYEYVDQNIKVQLVIYNTTTVIMFNSQRSQHIYCFSGSGGLQINNMHITSKPVVI